MARRMFRFGAKVEAEIEAKASQVESSDADTSVTKGQMASNTCQDLGMNAGEPICITSQYSALLNAMADCDSCDIDLDDFKDFIRDTLGYFPDEAPNLSSVKKSAFASLTNSVDIDLLDSVFQQFPCNECTGRLCEYKDKMMKSKYSEHKIPPLEEGMKCITSVFKDVADSSNPLCEDIVAKKSFCAAFDIKPAALRLVDCCELDDTTIILKWQLPQLPCIVDMFQKELSDSSLEILAPLKLRSLKVDSITLYFYQIKDITEPTQLQTVATFQPGDAVMIRNVIDEAEKLQEGHGGWNEDMTEILGKQAYVLQVDSDKDALLYIPAVKRKYMLNPALLEKIPGKSIELDTPDKPSTFEVGDAVVLCDLNKLVALQSKHNGITDDMCQNAGDIAFVVHIHKEKEEFVRIDMLPMRRTFHPCALIRIPRDISKVEEGIDFLKGKVSNDSAFMECVKKARNDTSDVHNLLMAILFRDEHKLCDYLERCHDKINTAIYKKHTALHLATLTGNISFVHILLDKGAKLDSKNEQGFASLHFATMSKFKDIAMVLLESQGGDINLKTIGGFTPLMIAATNNEDDIVQFLCDYPGNPTLNFDIKNAEGGTALHHAVQHNAMETVKVLLKHGADPTIPNHLGHNCFHVAAINGKENVMEPLVESYPQYAIYGDLKDITPLHWASYHGNYEVAQLLLDKTEINIDTRDSSGGTPLFAAALEGRTNIIHLLISYGADPNISRSDKETPLHALLHCSGKMDSIKEVSTELLKIKENLSSKSPTVKTIVACFLVRESADLKHKGKNNKMPTDLISNKEDLALIQSFSIESSNFKGSIQRHSIIPPNQNKVELWVEKRVATEPRECGHLFCTEHAKDTEKKCPHCNRQLKPLEDKSGYGKVCPICMKPDIDPLKSFSDMMNLPNDSDDESEEKSFQQALREMAASAAAEAVEHDCRQQ